MHNKQKITLFQVFIAFGLGAGLFLSFSAYAEEIKEKARIPNPCPGVESATSQPIASSSPAFIPSSQAVSMISPAVLSENAVSLQPAPLGQTVVASATYFTPANAALCEVKGIYQPDLTNTVSSVMSTPSLSGSQPDFIQAALEPMAGAVEIQNPAGLVQAQLPNLTSIPGATTISDTQPDFIQAAFEPMADATVTSAAAIVNPLTGNQPNENRSSGLIASLPGPIEPSTATPEHSINNVLSLPSATPVGYPEGTILVTNDDAGNSSMALDIATQAKIEADSLVPDKTNVNAETPAQNAQMLVDSSVKEHLIATEPAGQQTGALIKQIADRISHWGSELIGCAKTTFTALKSNIIPNNIVVVQDQNKDKEENKENTQKILPVLRQIVADKSIPLKVVEAKSKKDTIVLNKIKINAKNMTAGFQQLISSLIKGNIQTAKAARKEISFFSEKLSIRTAQWSEKITGNLAMSLIEIKNGIISDFISFMKESEKNLAKVRKVLPVLKRFVLNRLFPQKRADDTDDTVVFISPSVIIEQRDPLGFIAVYRYMINPGVIGKNTEFIDFLKPVNDHLIQNGLSPPGYRLTLRIRMFSLLIYRFCCARIAFALDKLRVAYQSLLSPCFINSGSFCRGHRGCLPYSSALSFLRIVILLNISFLLFHSRKPIPVGFFNFGVCGGIGARKFTYTGGTR